MKRNAYVSVLLVLMLSLAACGSGGGDKSSADQPANTTKTDTAANGKSSDNNDTKPIEDPKEATEDSAKAEEKDGPANPVDPMDLSQYYSSDKPVEKENDKSHILWKQGSVTLKASLGMPAEQERPETSQVVTSLTVDQKGRQIEVKLDPRPYNVSKAALSADESYLALSAEYHETSTLVIVDLQDGTYSTLNQQLEKNGKNKLEILPTFSWSPQGNVLAFSYGIISELSWGLYNADQAKLTFLPPAEGVSSLISTSCVMWSKDSQSVSYIGENPSDQMKLYRYSIADASTMKVKDLTREEFDKFQKFSSYILGTP